MHRLSALALLALTLLSPGTAEAQVQRLTHKDVRRRFIVYLPTGYAESADRRYPLVLNFHGGGMTMAEQMLYTRMNEAADRHGFIVVYPQGVNGDWNVGFEQSYTEGTDDVGFTDAMLDHLITTLRVDTTRVYATGLSRGAFFAQRLAAELSHRIAAIATVGAPLPVPVQMQQHVRGPLRTVGVMEVHGTDDQVVRHDGKADAYLSADSSRGYWVARNGLAGAPTVRDTVDGDPSDSLWVLITTVGRAAPQVVQLTIHGGGHTWPGADRFNVGLPIGRTSRELMLNDVMWTFFARHRRD